MKTFGEKLLARISTRDIDSYVQFRQSQGKAPRSINLEITFLRSLFKFAVTRHFAHENPAQHIQFVPCPEKERQIPTDDEYLRLIQAACVREAGKELACWLQLMAYTGMRPSEALFLEWADIDFFNDRITIRPKLGNPIKNKQFRTVNIHPELKPILQAWKEFWDKTFKENKPHNWVFFHPRQTNLRAKGFRTALCKAIKKAGISSFTPHILRHYFTSKAVMAGVPYGIIMKWLGHSSTRMIDKVYGHFYDDFAAQEMSKVKIGVKEKDRKSLSPVQDISKVKIGIGTTKVVKRSLPTPISVAS